MKHIVKDADGNKMLITVVTEIPELPEGFELIGPADEESIKEVEQKSSLQVAKVNALRLLKETDWKVIRHRDQVDAGLPTSMSAEEFTQLLNDRQAARDSI